MRVGLILLGGAEDGPVRGTGELIRQCAMTVNQHGGETVVGLYPASNMVNAVQDVSTDIVALAPAGGRRAIGRNVVPIVTMVRQFDLDVIHFHVPNYRWGLDAVLAAHAAPRRCRVVRTEHNPLMGGVTGLVRAALRAADAAVDRFAYCSIGNQRRWEAELPWRVGHGGVHLNMVDPARFTGGRSGEWHGAQPSLPESARRAVFVSAGWNVHDSEGRRPLAPVLRAMTGVPDDWHLLVVGDGDRSTAEDLANELGLTGRVHFLGPVADAWRIIRDADLLVNASHFEGLSIAFLEAWAQGVPVLSTRVDGIEDVIGRDHLECVTAEHGDIDGFTRRWSAASDPASPFSAVTPLATEAVRTVFARERWRDELMQLYTAAN